MKSCIPTVNAIACEVGYASAAGFFSAFHKAFGMTPARYRKTHSYTEMSEE
ncbi:MAG: helix-turn-helix transcriptional regulator [Clostridia bacterium]|nr:helix-turn-helix transcriptional regulator [Clostridia bacterium]